MKSIVLIIPYFGKLPNYFPAWKQSALNNPTIDFLFFTDIEELKDEKNIKTHHLSFEDFKALIQKKFDFPITLPHPYKLCDYKPIYGYVLQEYIKDYDFWGHCDIDLIFGDIRNFITDDILENHQKILEHGHFTLYRNDEETNTVFMRCPGYEDYDYKKAFTSSDSLYFDEALGTQLIFRKEKISTYLARNIFFDVQPEEKRFRHIEPYAGEIVFCWENGHLYFEEQIGTQLRKGELLYVHFQKRDVDYSAFCPGVSFRIVPNRLISVGKLPESRMFSCRGSLFYRYCQKAKHIKEYLKRYRQGNYTSFRTYREERVKFRDDLNQAKKEIAGYGKSFEAVRSFSML